MTTGANHLHRGQALIVDAAVRRAPRAVRRELLRLVRTVDDGLERMHRKRVRLDVEVEPRPERRVNQVP